jgi:hypothetical protein
MKDAYLLGVAATGFTAVFAFFTWDFFVSFLVVVGAGVVCAFGAAKMATADNRVMLMSFFIFVSPRLWRIVFARSQSYFAWNCVAAPSRR